MKRTLLLTLVLLAGVSTVPLQAQEIELPEYTDAQRWNRLAYLMVGWEAAMVAFGEEHGMAPEEVGHWVGEFFSGGWLGGREAYQMLTSINRNHMAFPNATTEVLGSTPNSVTVRFNRPWEAYLGAGGMIEGVAGEDLDAMFNGLESILSEWNGIGARKERDGDHDVVTLETLYGPIEASDRLRWTRLNYLSTLSWLQLLSLKMESGLTATEVGAQDAELYAPTWSSRTPWSLFRGMHRNSMTDPNFECEVLSAGPDEVRARCPIQNEALVNANGARFDVTLQDVLDSGRAFSEGVAEYLGMRWVETLEDGVRVITVTYR
jgi:hypothetical protein